MRKYFAFDKVMFGIMATILVVGLFVFLSASFSAFGNISKFGKRDRQIIKGECKRLAMKITSAYDVDPA